MPRKKSIGGRARGITVTSRLLREVKKANANLRNLDRAREYGTYASRRLLRNVVNSKNIRYNRKSKNIIRVKNMLELKTPEKRLILKDLEKFNRSKTATTLGVKRTREDVRKQVANNLGRNKGMKIDDSDVEKFFELVYDEDFRYFADKIEDSEAFIILKEVEKRNGGKFELGKLLQKHMTLNSEEARNATTKLFDKYFKD